LLVFLFLFFVVIVVSFSFSFPLKKGRGEGILWSDEELEKRRKGNIESRCVFSSQNNERIEDEKKKQKRGNVEENMKMKRAKGREGR
jgi:hypothetical protein